ncbi:MAG: Gldg family protein [Planctomycetota bacterium]
MRRLFAVQAILAVALLFLVAIYGARVLDHRFATRVALGATTRTELKRETLAYLRGLRGRIVLTYFASARGAMPSALKGVEREVRTLLTAFKNAAPDRIDVRVVDPAFAAPHGAAYAARKRAAPVSVRKIMRDESGAAAVWSALVVAHEQFPEALFPSVSAADVPHLEDWIVENLRRAEHSSQALIAVAAPAQGFASLLELLRGFEIEQSLPRVVAIDLGSSATIPHEADWLIWIEPEIVTRAHTEALERYLASGRSAIIAGSSYGIEYVQTTGGPPSYRVIPSRTDWRTLLRPFGLSLEPLLVLDKNNEAIQWQRPEGGVAKTEAPFQIRIPPSLFDTKSLLGPNAGALLVSALSPVRVEVKTVLAARQVFEVIATTSEHTKVLELPESQFDATLFASAEAVPKQPWMVLLRPDDPWRGDLIVVGSSLLFHDAPYAQGGNANAAFLKTLARTYLERSRIARQHVPRHEPQRVAELSLGARVAWRGIAVFLVPCALAFLALRAAWARGRVALRLGGFGRALASVSALVAVLCTVQWLTVRGDASWDLTAEQIHTPSALTRRLISAAPPDMTCELLMSDRERMPGALKNLEARITSTLRGLDLHPRKVRPENFRAEELAQLAAAGIHPFEVETIENDAPTVTRVWSALRFERAGVPAAVIPMLDAAAVEQLEFLVADAVQRLEGRAAPIVGVLSDLPRLTPGEALEFQQKGHIAPIGSDVYSFAKRVLAQHGYDVVYIHPETPVFPPNMKALVWLQPRLPDPALPLFANYLAAGGSALVAVQHFNVLQRQHPGSEFKTVYWPQPQFHTFNEYLRLIGLRLLGEKRPEQPGEILFDRSHASLMLDTQVNRAGQREHDPQQVSQPFIIRVASEGLASTSLITRKLGELLFIWGSRFELNSEALRTQGITSRVLASTSERSWTYAWSGGFIPPETFVEPATGLIGRQPLAIELQGSFPRLDLKKDEQGRQSFVASAASEPIGAAGQLLLIGCSEMFKNSRLFLPEYQHDQFLLNSVALLAHGPELAEVAARRQAPRSFAFQPPEVKLRWRWIILGSVPLVVSAVGLVAWRWRQRPLLQIRKQT